MASLTALAGKWKQRVTRYVSNFVVTKGRARVILLPVAVDPRLPVDVVVVLKLRRQLAELPLVTFRVTCPCQDGTVALANQQNASIEFSVCHIFRHLIVS